MGTSDLADDEWRMYVYNLGSPVLPGAYDLVYYPSEIESEAVVMGQHAGVYFTDHQQIPIDYPEKIEGEGYVRNTVTINICVRQEPSQPPGTDNPQVALQSTFVSRSMCGQESN